MKKQYENPTVDLLYVNSADILTLSNGWDDDQANDPDYTPEQ